MSERRRQKRHFGAFKKTCLLSTDGAQSARNRPSIHKLQRIERLRAKKNISVAELCAVAGVRDRQWYRWMKGITDPKPSSLRALDKALQSLTKEQELDERSRNAHQSVYHLLLSWMAACANLDIIAVLKDDPQAQDKQSPFKAKASQCRQRALYLIVTEMDVPLVVAAGLAGISKQAVSKALRSIEDSRDDPSIDELLTHAAVLLCGGDHV